MGGGRSGWIKDTIRGGGEELKEDEENHGKGMVEKVWCWWGGAGDGKLGVVDYMDCRHKFRLNKNEWDILFFLQKKSLFKWGMNYVSLFLFNENKLLII